MYSRDTGRGNSREGGECTVGTRVGATVGRGGGTRRGEGDAPALRDFALRPRSLGRPRFVRYFRPLRRRRWRHFRSLRRRRPLRRRRWRHFRSLRRRRWRHFRSLRRRRWSHFRSLRRRRWSHFRGRWGAGGGGALGNGSSGALRGGSPWSHFRSPAAAPLLGVGRDGRSILGVGRDGRSRRGRGGRVPRRTPRWCSR